MGVALYITAENPPENLDLFVNGKALADASPRLASVAKELGVPDLMSFFSQSPEDAADFLEDETMVDKLPAEEWYSPSDGLRSVRALLAHFITSPEEVGIVEDLREFEKALLLLETEGLRWHLSIDF